jgi:purine-nucleoside phosphorylase
MRPRNHCGKRASGVVMERAAAMESAATVKSAATTPRHLHDAAASGESRAAEQRVSTATEAIAVVLSIESILFLRQT